MQPLYARLNSGGLGVRLTAAAALSTWLVGLELPPTHLRDSQHVPPSSGLTAAPRLPSAVVSTVERVTPPARVSASLERFSTG